jgi:hypothetical protein
VAGKGGKKNSRTLARAATSPHHFPIDARDKLFCERWLEHFDGPRAYSEAGFKGSRKKGERAQKKLTRFAEYLRPLREAKARVVAERLEVEQSDVLEAMARKAAFKLADFIEVAPTPITYEEKDAQGAVTVKTRMWEGKPIHATRMKPIEALTPQQLASVEVTGSLGGVLQYRLPTTREQHTYLKSLGEQLGMFLQKVIWENHQHRHLHAHLHLEDVPTTKILQLTRDLMPLVGPDFAAQLGFTKEEFDEASQAGGVLMPETGK